MAETLQAEDGIGRAIEVIEATMVLHPAQRGQRDDDRGDRLVTAYDDSNIFAKMLRGEIPAHKVYEDADVLVTMDIFPQSRGHALVIPKAPSRNLLDADPAVLGKVMPTVQRVGRAVVAATEGRWPAARAVQRGAGGTVGVPPALPPDAGLRGQSVRRPRPGPRRRCRACDAGARDRRASLTLPVPQD